MGTLHLFPEKRLGSRQPLRGSLFCDSCAKHPVSFQHGSSLMPTWLRGHETNTSLFIKNKLQKTTHKYLALNLTSDNHTHTPAVRTKATTQDLHYTESLFVLLVLGSVLMSFPAFGYFCLLCQRLTDIFWIPLRCTLEHFKIGIFYSKCCLHACHLNSNLRLVKGPALKTKYNQINNVAN